MQKKLLSGYFDEKIYEGEEFIGQTPFDEDINTFVKGVIQWWSEETGKEEYEFDNLSENEKMDTIIKYVEADEIAGSYKI